MVTTQIGLRLFTIERNLSDLSLKRLCIDDQDISDPTEELYQREVLEAAELWSFGDWLLLLRHLVFYFEDRRALVWDPAAQRQILRFLFLSPLDAEKWTTKEREILTLDSRMRNLNAALTKEEKEGRTLTRLNVAAPGVRAQLESLESMQKEDEKIRDQLGEESQNQEGARSKLRLNLLRAEQDREHALRELERHKLAAISTAFPSAHESARYILAHLLSESNCLVCGTEGVDAVVVEMVDKLKHGRCVICDSLTGSDRITSTAELTGERQRALEAALSREDVRLRELQKEYSEINAAYRETSRKLAEIAVRINERSTVIENLVNQLPPEEAAVRNHHDDLATLRLRVQEMRADLQEKRREFSGYIEKITRQINSTSERIKEAFSKYASGFLLERCTLTWAPQNMRVGQGGDVVEYPGFALEMAGSDFFSPMRREGPEQVSESQREFIDLAFRMALIETAGMNGSGSLVIDAPESSLDGVFVHRAAVVLSRYALANSQNRLIVTSNLLQGDLIPELMRLSADKDDRANRIVDLFEISVPTAAVKELAEEYRELRRQVFRKMEILA